MASLFLVKDLQFRGYVIGTKVIAGRGSNIESSASFFTLFFHFHLEVL